MVARDARGGTTPTHGLPVDHSRDVFSIPNVITVLRLALVPCFYWFLVYDAPASGPNNAAFLLFTVSAATDWLDGFIARRTGHVTAVGKIIDPLVDRLLIAGALVGLYVTSRVSLWLVVLLIGRDVYLLYGAWVLERHGRRLPVTLLGKVTTAVLLIGFASLIWNFPFVPVPVFARYELFGHTYAIGGARPLGAYIVYLGVALSLAAAARYTVTAQAAYREALGNERASLPTDGSPLTQEDVR
ncbi:MAG: CDP-alcohol phosphatidyltransferase family protein [Coriobacteriia bacterium]|nr:CDP-alcohol phosphatidyltransferase family protein [Coriobacteriia bacterium]